MRNETRSIEVWDRLVRSLHWALALLFFIAFATGDDSVLHRCLGYAIALLVVIRILWGFIGTKYALFKNFLCPPRNALVYLGDLMVGRPSHYIGHNPAAAWMILFLLIGSLFVCISGYFASNGKKGGQEVVWSSMIRVEVAHADESENDHSDQHSPSKHHRQQRQEHKAEAGRDTWWEAIHEATAQFVLGLVAIHIIGVLLSSIKHRENLVMSMISGRKSIQD